MTEPRFSLMTLEYPPQVGGIATYLRELVRASQGTIEVIDVSKVSRSLWPRWWPLVDLCRREAAKGKILFVSHVFPVGTAAWITHLLTRAPYVVLFHGLDLRLVRSIWKRWLLRRICYGATALFVNSHSTASILQEKAPECTAEILTPGVDEQPFLSREDARQRLGRSAEQRIVLSIARLVPRKGIDVALRAMARIQKKIHVEYVVIGKGEDAERLSAIAQQEGTRVHWISQADDPQKNLWLAASDVFLLPVRETPIDVEGFGIVYLEAAKAGIPAIAGKTGGAAEAVVEGETGLLVDSESVDEVEMAALRCLENPELRERLGRKARERAGREFRWADRWAKLCQSVKG